MFRTRGFLAVALAFCLTATFACSGGGEGGQAEASSAAESEEAQSPAMAESETESMQEGGQEGQMALPEGVTQEMVTQGKEVFGTSGLCYVCHGQNGEGMPGLGANLDDDEWIHSDGSYESIVKTIMDGVDSSKSTTGTAMPPKGGSSITDEQVRAVAAYVYSLSHREM